ncbi:hypothetical protein E2P81_ATG03830 [Venturia nashicola]|nr:hypothetical protein E2P81_ATG03830 [Venturia nashicola]
MTFLRTLFTSSAKKEKKETAALAALLAEEREEIARLEEFNAASKSAQEVEVWMSEQREKRLHEKVEHLLLVADRRAERARYYLGRAQQYRRTAAYSDEDKATMDEMERQEAMDLELDLGSVELNED